MSSFCDFRKNYLLCLNRIFLLFDTRKSCVFQIFFILRSIKAYLCPNMIHFDIVDFSERQPEEVISSFDAQCIFDVLSSCLATCRCCCPLNLIFIYLKAKSSSSDLKKKVFCTYELLSTNVCPSFHLQTFTHGQFNFYHRK